MPTPPGAAPTTYGFNNDSGRAEYTANLGVISAYTVFDSGGIDTLNYSGFDANQRIDLTQENFSDVGGGIGNVTIAFGTIIENAIGGSGNDNLLGNSANNTLTGGGGDDVINGMDGNDTLIGGFGNDSLNGANGTDTVSYAAAFAGVTVNLATQSAQSTAGGDAAAIGIDTLFAIENILGSNFADVLTGDGFDNQVDGAGGDDVISGGNRHFDWRVGQRHAQWRGRRRHAVFPAWRQ
jgi:serralysin